MYLQSNCNGVIPTFTDRKGLKKYGKNLIKIIENERSLWLERSYFRCPPEKLSLNHDVSSARVLRLIQFKHDYK